MKYMSSSAAPFRVRCKAKGEHSHIVATKSANLVLRVSTVSSTVYVTLCAQHKRAYIRVCTGWTRIRTAAGLRLLKQGGVLQHDR